VPRKQGSTPSVKASASADGGPRAGLSKSDQIKAIEAKKRKEAHEVEKAKLDAIEEKIQAARKRIEEKKKQK
jgi:hypothetical protein